MPGSPDTPLSLMIVVVCGTLGAMVASFFIEPDEQADGRRAPEPYVGFLYGAIVGAVGVIGWPVFF